MLTPRSTYWILLCGRSRLGVSVSRRLCIVSARCFKKWRFKQNLCENVAEARALKKKFKTSLVGGKRACPALHTETVRLLLFIFFICSSLFTMFESTKFNLFMTVHIYSFVFLFLYHVFCSPFVAVLYIVCMDFFSLFFVFVLTVIHCCYHTQKWRRSASLT